MILWCREIQALAVELQAKIVLYEEQHIPEKVLSGSDVICIKEEHMSR